MRCLAPQASTIACCLAVKALRCETVAGEYSIRNFIQASWIAVSETASLEESFLAMWCEATDKKFGQQAQRKMDSSRTVD
jgi:hypothetical protein